MSAHHEYRDQLAAYALGALEAHELLEVERHMAGCEDCREYLLWLDPAVDLLPASVEPMTPPRELKRNLMEAVQEDLKSERRAERDRKRAEHGLWGTIWRPVTAGVLTVVLVAGAIVGYSLRGEEPESEFFEAQTLANMGPEMEATLEVQGNEGTLHVKTLPSLGPDQDYQAWIQRDGEMNASTTFEVREDGDVAIEGSLEGADGVYITREPEGGSDTPSEKPILGAEIS
jgi:anti-sigma-K factor RskA